MERDSLDQLSPIWHTVPVELDWERILTTMRHVGRPDARAAERLDQHIIEIATRLFSGQGFTATSIDQIAIEAGVGKQTIYRRYTSKEELFRATADAMVKPLLIRSAEAAFSPDPLLALREACEALLDTVLRPEMIAMYRVLIAEANRFPGLAEHILGTAIEPFHEIIHELIRGAIEQGRIRVVDPVYACHALTGMIVSWPLNHALLTGRRVLTEEADRRAHIETAWAIFTQGMVPRSAR
jgi:AcrR family transcriptional regulator